MQLCHFGQTQCRPNGQNGPRPLQPASSTPEELDGESPAATPPKLVAPAVPASSSIAAPANRNVVLRILHSPFRRFDERRSISRSPGAGLRALSAIHRFVLICAPRASYREKATLIAKEHIANREQTMYSLNSPPRPPGGSSGPAWNPGPVFSCEPGPIAGQTRPCEIKGDSP
jgi:hypothetical protein